MTWNKKNDILGLFVGHGTMTNGVWDSGAVYGSYTEADLMLPIVKAAVKILRKAGVRVITDADTNNNKNMNATIEWANSTGCKYYISVHCDYKGATRGVAPLYRSATGKKMATTIGKYVAQQMGMRWKGAFYRTDCGELNKTKMPAVIFETGAIKADLKYLKESAKYGKALAYGILKYIGVKPVVHTNAWKLRVGAKKITAYMKKHNFKYKASWKDNALSWTAAKKRKHPTTNCSTMVSYALQKKGFLKPGEYFWINGDNIVCKGGLTIEKLKKIATISHPHKPPKTAGLKKGDIVGFGSPYNAHTMIFAGFKNGKPTWYSTGSTTEIGKGGAHVKKTYTGRPISTIIRLK